MDINQMIQKLKNREPSILGEEHFFKSAVLLPLVEVNQELHILFEVRSMNLRRQPGDICFPGGRIDEEDQTPMHCAVRETTEELGIKNTDIVDVFPLDYVVADMGRIIYPYVGRIKNPEEIVPNKDEVGEVFTIPLDYLLENEPDVYKVHFEVKPADDFPFDLIIGGENYQWQMRHMNEMFYQYDGRVVWGLTAKILYHFISLVKC
ncbi:CoA pyrophosphatase [Bacilli bacterium]|uniref:NUDIX hydrolase n=1 Tax=Oceanobacillus caeni TaxID=405946 RepID=UPI00062265BC|nr:CoA pyrophosphatase [Oceanobacillus caeni]KKE79267.1 NUDIX hydrolase [Bacilli bacterium VT-13-104]PZD86817.1 CoA pyrophosphatase [Bacilli bacterium]MBU8790665.1 CoA pyrophosphatase [Oceanobacillus caeni]PZD88191.1 CoA pyrophosphatase [Bacilli bacterium]PZD91468.1 CoA pyrophosphatase [Bacilli bacterium]